MVLGRAGLRSERGYGDKGHNANGLPLTGYEGNRHVVETVLSDRNREEDAGGSSRCYPGPSFPAFAGAGSGWGTSPAPGTERRGQALVPVPLRVGAQRRAGTGEGVGGRGTLDRTRKGGHRYSSDALPCGSMYVGLLCCPETSRQQRSYWPGPDTVKSS